MKSKIVFMILLLSLLLNIGHDFLIDKQFKTNSTILEEHQKIKKITSKHQILDLHEIFHFHALLIKHKSIENFPKFLRNMLYVEKLSPQIIFDSSFKPPRA